MTRIAPAGADITAMVLYPEDEKFLLAAPELRHHEVPFPPQNLTSPQNLTAKENQE